MNQYEQKTKPSSLTTSPKTYQRGRGSGYSNMVCLCLTGGEKLGGVSITNDWFSLLVTRFNSLLVGTSHQRVP